MYKSSLGRSKGISPIIATLLLILIAIAAGVLVYVYVTGYIGSSTQNGGGTTDTLSIDNLVLTSKAGSSPVTAFVRNLGPNAETFNTGFYVKSATVNNQLGLAVVVSGSGATDTLTRIQLVYASATSMTVTVTGCTGVDTMTVKGFGASASAACASGSASVTLSIASAGFTISSGFSSDSGIFAGTNVGTGAASAGVVGTALTAASTSMSVAQNTVAQFTLAPVGINSNPLSSGSTYTFSANGGDSAIATFSTASK